MTDTHKSSTLVFPHPTLTIIKGKPTNATVQLLKKEVIANARSIPTHLDATHGYLSLLVEVDEYKKMNNGVAFPVPVHPGPTVTHQPNSDAAQMTENVRIHNAAITEFDKYTIVRETIKKQLIAAVERIYLSEIDHDDFGFAMVSPGEILGHH